MRCVMTALDRHVLYLTAGDGIIRVSGHDLQITRQIAYKAVFATCAIQSFEILRSVQWESVTADTLAELDIHIADQGRRITGYMSTIRVKRFATSQPAVKWVPISGYTDNV